MMALYAPKFGRARVIGEPSGFYQPAPALERGSPPSASVQDAAILGVADRTGAIADIVAWRPDDPWRWWVRTGAVPVLGEAEIERAAFHDAPLWLFATPSDWLFNHDRRGYWPAACVLDWAVDPCVIFRGIRITAHGETVARKLEQAQRRYDRPLSVQVAMNEAERAAA
jgi:antitoxin (DNA-binding transcriptional repressor) of toxin-antitoxin stability system